MQFYLWVHMLLSVNSDYFLNPIKLKGNYMYRLLYQSVTLQFVYAGFVLFSALTWISFLKSVNKLIAVMVKCGVLFEVRAKFLSTI
jgi:D-alanyl-lipoteichoic acid acyltransferase DltB (MBOAT superfamily)